MEQNCTVRLQLRARYLRLFVGILLLLQLLVPYKGWMILLVGLGAAWLLAYLWARSLAHGLELTREMRYGWPIYAPVPCTASIAHTNLNRNGPFRPGAGCANAYGWLGYSPGLHGELQTHQKHLEEKCA